MKKYKKISVLIIYISGVVVTIFFWWLATSNPESMLFRFNPKDTFFAFWNLLGTDHFWKSFFSTFKRLLLGVGMAFIIGLPIGIIIGFFQKANNFSYFTFQFLRMISPLSWTPVAIIVFGIGDNPVYFLVSIAAVWPIVLNISSGVQLANKELVEVAKGLGANNWQIIKYVIYKSSLPSILVGIQLAIGVGWIVIVPAEMLGVSSGLGYMILDYRDINDYASIMAIIIAIGFLGVFLDYPLKMLTKKINWN